MADRSNSRCKQIQEGKKPYRSCSLCRREDCEVWQECLERVDNIEQDLVRTETELSPSSRGELRADG